MMKELISSDYIILGEEHGDLEHQRLALKIIRELRSVKKPLALVLEMFSPHEEMLFASSSTFEKFSSLVHWEERGWPKYENYTPLLRYAYATKILITGGEGERTLNNPSSLEEKKREISWEKTIADHQCGLGRRAEISALAKRQIRRDRFMAHALLKHPSTLLLAGREHGMKWRGVPSFLGKKAISIAFFSFEENKHTRLMLQKQKNSFDYVIILPKSSEPSPCNRLKKILHFIE